MRSNNFRNLEVTAWLGSAVIADRFLPLDGILLYQQTRQRLGPADYTLPGQSTIDTEGADQFDLPLAHVESGREWYYRCSFAQWSAYIDGTDHWAKRYDNGMSDYVDFSGRGTVDIAAGRYKAYHHPVFYRSALYLRWYCVGDMDKIAELLSVTTHIGKKTAQGWGRVREWKIRLMQNDYSIVRNGSLMRAVPKKDVPHGISYNMANYGIRPSYWKKSNQFLVAMPI